MKFLSKKFFFFVGVFILLMSSNLLIGRAATLSSEKSLYYYERKNADGSDYYPGSLKNFFLDGKAAYCIEPGVYAGSTGYSESSWGETGLKEEIKRDIVLYAYYGYDYPGHQTLNYRAATQALIWEKIVKGSYIEFNTGSRGTGQPVSVDTEKTEIQRLVDNHDVVPSFAGQTQTIPLGKTITIQDTNGVLKDFKVENDAGATVSIDKETNSLNITTHSQNLITISFIKETKYDSEYKVYRNPGWQNILVTGEAYPVSFSMSVKGEGAKVTLNKVDDETNKAQGQGNASLQGAVYGIYQEDGTLLEKVTTNENGMASSPNFLDYGRYYVQEISPSLGYELDLTKHYFENTQGGEEIVLQVKEHVIKTKFNFIKVYASAKTGALKPEANVEFAIYNEQGQLITKTTTDQEGKMFFELPYGNYILRQITDTLNCEKLTDYHFKATQKETITQVFADDIITARLKVIKYDLETGRVIPLSGVKFKIFDKNNNCYVTEDIVYPHRQTIDTFETDADGVLITPFILESGTYILEEVDAPIPGYLWNKQKIEFTIDKNSDFIDTAKYGKVIEIEFGNQPVKGEILITKQGEIFNFDGQHYDYSFIPLASISFGLYAKEDIYDNFGKIIYQKDALIGKYLTDEDGQIKIEDLPLGKYYLKELATWPGYILDSKIYDVDLKYQDQHTAVVKQSYELTNYLIKKDVTIRKADRQSHLLLPGVCYNLYDENDELIMPLWTNEDGVINITLPVGKYYLKETKTLAGYIIDVQNIPLEIREDTEDISLTLSNQKIMGTLKFFKTDAATGEFLANTVIGLYDAATNELIRELTTDENGQFTITLPYGKYYLKELKPQPGYILTSKIIPFEIQADGEEISIIMSNQKIMGTLKFTKIDAVTGEFLANTVIGLYDAATNELIRELTTDENGQIAIDLPYGEYYIKELQAPEGYVLSEEQIAFAITQDGDVITINMQDDEIIIEVPDTLANSTSASSFILIIMLLGWGGYELKRKNSC